jgi:protein SCO1/2
MKILRTIFVSSALVLICSAAVSGQAGDAAKKYFTDTVVVDQDGKERRFYTDLMEGKVVVMASFHADCNSIGPPMMATLRKIQQNLEGRAKEFNIIALSVDPTDTPAKAKVFAEKFKAGPGWYFVTGQKPNMDVVLKKLGMYVENKEDHTSVLIIGNVKTGLWKKAFGLAKVDDLQKIIEGVLDDKGLK